MSKRSVKNRNRKPDAVKVTFRGLVAAGQEKAALAKLTKLVPQIAPTADDIMLEVAEDDTDHGETFHVHGDSCVHEFDHEEVPGTHDV